MPTYCLKVFLTARHVRRNEPSTAYNPKVGIKRENHTKPDTSSRCLHTAALPRRVLPHGVVDQVVVQKREVVVICGGSTAGLGGRVFRGKPLVVSEVVKDFVVVGLRLSAGPRAVPEYHLLAGAVAQAQVRHVEVDLFERTALSSLGLPRSSPVPGSPSTASTPPLGRPFPPLPSVSSAAAHSFCRGRGGGGEGGATHSADGPFDEVHHVLKLAWGWFLRGV